jgi:hypothetical protein
MVASAEIGLTRVFQEEDGKVDIPGMGRKGMRAAMFVLQFSLVALILSGPAQATVVVRTVGSDGHATHPVWYHDATAVDVGNRVDMAWTTNHGSVAGRSWNRTSNGWVGPSAAISQAILDCGCTDSTGTNPNRHDVPALFADPAGRVYAVYGGGTASKTGGQTGPYFNAAPAPDGGLPVPAGETLLSIPGAAYDFEVTRDGQGVNHLIGQQGDTPPGDSTGAGSLLYLRFLPGSGTAPGAFQQFGGKPYLTLVRGGYQASACAWAPIPGCDVFVIGRIAQAPRNPSNPSQPNTLYVSWGWSEGSLSSCADPAGFCNHGLYLAKSTDGGTTWCNAAGAACIDVTATPILYDDANFNVVPPTTDVGLFKGLAVNGPFPGTPWIVWQPAADQGHGMIRAARWSGGAWHAETLDASRAWNNHLVLRAAGGRVYLWSDIAQTGTRRNDLDRWLRDPASGRWTRATLTVGPNWFLTGRAVRRGEVLMWRVPSGPGVTTVAFTLLAVG